MTNHYKSNQKSSESAPVGVVPRWQARSIHSLTSDVVEARTVTEEIKVSGNGGSPSLPQWLSSVTALGVIATAMEWLKLTR